VRNSIYRHLPYDWRAGVGYRKMSGWLNRANAWPPATVEQWQLKRLREIVSYAYKNVPGYFWLYRDAGVDANCLRSLQDIRLLPAVTRELLRDNLDDFTSRATPKWLMRYATTSGSTGIPLGFYCDLRSRAIESAFMHHFWRSAGWRKNPVMAVLRGGFTGTNSTCYSFDRVWKELHLSSYYLSESKCRDYVEALAHYRPSVLQSYPSAAFELARLLMQADTDVGRMFDIVLLGSENVYPYQVETVRVAFPNARVLWWYGHSERAIFAPWNIEDHCYDVAQLYGVAELLATHPGEQKSPAAGELIGTSLWNRATPFIRYKTNDLVPWEDAAFLDTGILKSFHSVIGRRHNQLMSVEGRLAPVPTTSLHDDTLKKVKQFQFFQDTPGLVWFSYVASSGLEPEDIKTIMDVFTRKMGEGFEFRARAVEALPRTKSGKSLVVDQRLSTRNTEESGRADAASIL